MCIVLPLLQESWQLLQGRRLGGMEGAGVIVGIQQMEYGGLAAPHLQSMGPFSATGSSHSVAAGRISYTYGLKGPAISVDTACSSALVAVHQAVGGVLRGVVDVYLACGVNLMLSEATFAAAQAAGMLTMDGRCKSMDQAADGYARCCDVASGRGGTLGPERLTADSS